MDNINILTYIFSLFEPDQLLLIRLTCKRFLNAIEQLINSYYNYFYDLRKTSCYSKLIFFLHDTKLITKSNHQLDNQCKCCYLPKSKCKCTLNFLLHSDNICSSYNIDWLFLRAASKYTYSSEYPTKILRVEDDTIIFQLYFFAHVYHVSYNPNILFKILNVYPLNYDSFKQPIIIGQLINNMYFTFANYLIIKSYPELKLQSSKIWDSLLTNCQISTFLVEPLTCFCCDNNNLSRSCCNNYNLYFWPILIMHINNQDYQNSRWQYFTVKEKKDGEIKLESSSLTCWSRVFYRHLYTLLNSV